MTDLVKLEPHLKCLRAPNPSPMTFTGTNTYLLGAGPYAVIDPGPDDRDHLNAIMAATDGAVSHILVTHAHLDHSPLARPLSDLTTAPVMAYGDAGRGRSDVMTRLATTSVIGGGEGVDTAFTPDYIVEDGATLRGVGWTLTALWTPGHFCNHLCFDWGGRIFSGDLVMGWASSLVSPPDGDLTQFMDSCSRVRRRDGHILYPGHGDPVTDPAARLDWLMDHRRMREVQIHTTLAEAPATASLLAARLYTDIPPRMLPVAERNVLAHLIDLHQKKMVATDAPLRADSLFRQV